ncbi:hypothetical protein BHE74_00046462, partial [Ensete ventricosum]
RSVFGASSRNFKILYIPNGLAHGKSYEHGLVKKCDGHKLCTKSRFDRFFMHRLSRNFKILAIPNVLAHRKLYEHSFVIKRDGHKLYAKSRAKSSFDWFLVHRLGILKYSPFSTY